MVFTELRPEGHCLGGKQDISILGRENNKKESEMTRIVRPINPWECPWYPVESAIVDGIPFVHLWWTHQTHATVPRLLARFVDRIDNPALESHLNSPDGGHDHFNSMILSLENRISWAVRCPSGEILLQTALDPNGFASQFVSDHLKICRSCRTQVTYLGQQAEDFFPMFKDVTPAEAANN